MVCLKTIGAGYWACAIAEEPTNVRPKITVDIQAVPACGFVVILHILSFSSGRALQGSLSP
jgi:hypothetical protein